MILSETINDLHRFISDGSLLIRPVYVDSTRSTIIRITSCKGVRSMGFESRRFGPRTMHKIKCSDCGRDAEVPFVPKEGRPVYCRECFQKHRTY